MFSFVWESIRSARRGIAGIFYPILLRMMQGVLRLGLLSTFLLIIIWHVEFGISPEAAVWLGCLVGFLLGSWWIFSASCRLMWWKMMAAGSEKSAMHGSWLRDLPAVLGLDLVFGATVWLCVGAMTGGIFGMMMARPLIGAIVAVGSGMLALVGSVLHPAVLANRLVWGHGLMWSVRNAVGQLIRNPARMLVVLFIPTFTSLTLYGLAVCEAILGNVFLMGGLVAGGVLISLIKPVFWTEFAIRSE